MREKILILILGTILTGCGTFYKEPGLYDHIDFKAYTNAYLEYKEQYLGVRKVDYAIDIEYKHLDVALGRCYSDKANPFRTRNIEIDYTFWQNASEEARLELIFHELGHCDLNCPHQDEVDGIMNTYGFRPRVTDKAIKNLFLECK